jgi:hypothetical protein
LTARHEAADLTNGQRVRLSTTRSFANSSGDTVSAVSDAANDRLDIPHGKSLLPRDLTSDELLAAPVLDSVDALLIDGLTDDEDDAFAAAVTS